ncbi:MAG: LemA family protein [Clostridia bacterium]|nr:LemA family protein [Clostridia bacterium]
MWIAIILIVLVILILFIVGIYNKLVSLKMRVQNAWAQIDTQLKRRFDLIPNLVETIKGYTKHEEGTLTKVIEARNKYVEASGNVEASAEAEKSLAGSLKQLFALAESYPDLKANENFKELQIELTGTEDKIAYSRQFYNDTVTMYNEALMVFPNNIVVSLFGQGKFEPAKFFEIENAEERKNVKVQF